MNLSQEDTEFSRGHLRKWCERTRREHQFEAIWTQFMKRAYHYFHNNYGWTEIADLAGLPKPRN